MFWHINDDQLLTHENVIICASRMGESLGLIVGLFYSRATFSWVVFVLIILLIFQIKDCKNFVLQYPILNMNVRVTVFKNYILSAWGKRFMAITENDVVVLIKH